MDSTDGLHFEPSVHGSGLVENVADYKREEYLFEDGFLRNVFNSSSVLMCSTAVGESLSINVRRSSWFLRRRNEYVPGSTETTFIGSMSKLPLSD